MSDAPGTCPATLPVGNHLLHCEMTHPSDDLDKILRNPQTTEFRHKAGMITWRGSWSLNRPGDQDSQYHHRRLQRGGYAEHVRFCDDLANQPPTPGGPNA